MPSAEPSIVAGRTCPADYGYRPEALAREAELRVDTLWVVGGLYGNPFALHALREAFDAEPEPKALVFNGDFHWFDVDAGDFAAINQAVLRYRAIRGNVETELARADSGAGCGCGYPDWVDDDTVTRSNRILERLRATAERVPLARQRLATLPMHMRVDVGELRVGVVHGDADSLAGWTFSQETLGTRGGFAAAQRAFMKAEVDVLASSHTCLPVLQHFPAGVLVNNGAAGMPNFAGELYGLGTRIAVSPHRDVVHAARLRGLFVEAVPIRYDKRAWQQRFLEQWPAGSDAHASYFGRIVNGPRYSPAEALRRGAMHMPINS